MQVVPKTSPEPYRSDLQVCFSQIVTSPTTPGLIRSPPRKVPITIHPEHRQEPEIQRIHLPADSILRAVQVFLQFILLAGRPLAVRSCAKDWFVPYLYFRRVAQS